VDNYFNKFLIDHTLVEKIFVKFEKQAIILYTMSFVIFYHVNPKSGSALFYCSYT